jgi:hypothetical protein
MAAFPKRTLAMQLWNFTDRFVRERKILNNVSSATADRYHYSLKAFKPALEAEYNLRRNSEPLSLPASVNSAAKAGATNPSRSIPI